MDVISSYDLQRYETILSEINREHEKATRLRNEIQQTNDQITFQKLSLSPCQNKISHVSVKVFSSVAEIENLYDCDTTSLYCNNWENCNFFLIEVFLTKALLAKVDSKWKLHIAVNTEKFAINKVVLLGKTNKESILEIIKVNNVLTHGTVSACLFCHFENHWSVVDLHSVNVDISFHFEALKEKSKHESLLQKQVNITSLYNNTGNTYVEKPLEVQHQMHCDLLQDKFMASFVRNSYHRLHLETFSDFVKDTKSLTDFQFLINSDKCVILYHKDNKILKIKGPRQWVLPLRKFFFRLFPEKVEGLGSKIQNIGAVDVEDKDLDEILLLHKQLKRLWL